MSSPMNYLGYTFWPLLSLSCMCWLFISYETLQHLSLSRTCQLPPSGAKSWEEGTLLVPCIPAIPRTSSLFLQHFGAAVSHNRILCLNTSDAQTQCHCVHKLSVTVCPVMQLGKAGGAGTQGIPECVCVSVCFHQPPSASAEKRKGALAACVCVLGEFPQELWKATGHLWLTVHTLAASPVCCAPVSGALGCSALLLVEWATGKVAAVSLARGRVSRCPGCSSLQESQAGAGSLTPNITSHSWSSGSLRILCSLTAPGDSIAMMVL